MNACFDQPALAAGVLVTLEPLPFANAEGPLKVLASDHSPARHTAPAGHLGEAQAPSAHTGSHAHSPSKGTAAPGQTLCLPANSIKHMFLGACQAQANLSKLPVCPYHDPCWDLQHVWHLICSAYLLASFKAMPACLWIPSLHMMPLCSPAAEYSMLQTTWDSVVFSKPSLAVTVPRTCPRITE